MKAWQFVKTHDPIVLADVDVPKPGPGQVLLEMKAAGLCHTDVGVLEDEGWMQTLAKTPITMGHENAGEIIEVGEGVTEWKVGDRVGVCPTTELGAPGFLYDGGMAEKIVVDQITLVRIPEGVSWEYGAAATDAGMTSHHAVISRGGVKAGDTVGIIGLGGLGQIGARVAVLAGATVYGADLNEGAWDAAKELGVTEMKRNITDYDIEFDVIVDFAGFGQTTADAINKVRYDGTVVIVGMGKLEANVSTMAMILKHVNFYGSVGGTKEDIASVYKHMAEGNLKPTTTAISFDEIPEGLERLEKGGIVGRLVAVR